MSQYRVYITTLATGEQFKTPCRYAAIECMEARGGISVKESYVSKPYEQTFGYRKTENDSWGEWPTY